MAEYKLYKPFYDPEITPRGKKYSVYVRDEDGRRKLIHFGDVRYEQFYDKIGKYYAQNHHDLDRRQNYLNRAQGIRDKLGRFTYKLRWSPNYYSVKYLW